MISSNLVKAFEFEFLGSLLFLRVLLVPFQFNLCPKLSLRQDYQLKFLLLLLAPKFAFFDRSKLKPIIWFGQFLH